MIQVQQSPQKYKTRKSIFGHQIPISRTRTFTDPHSIIEPFHQLVGDLQEP